MAMLRRASLVLALLAFSCVGKVGDGEQDSDVAVAAGELSIKDMSDGVTGSYVVADETVWLSSRWLSDTTLDIQVEVHGMMLTALVDMEQVIVEYDGYASDNGQDTQITDVDRAMLASLSNAIDALADPSPALSKLGSFANVWSEFPDALPMQGAAYGESERSYTSICQHLDTFQQATHDDWDYDRWDDASTYYGYLSMHGPGSCSDETYFWKDGSWQCYEPDHSTAVEYAYGACFGRCGEGCGSDTQFTWDCLDHDSCVRFGHSSASLWCNDEFVSTIDDWASAPDCL